MLIAKFTIKKPEVWRMNSKNNLRELIQQVCPKDTSSHHVHVISRVQGKSKFSVVLWVKYNAQENVFPQL